MGQACPVSLLSLAQLECQCPKLIGPALRQGRAVHNTLLQIRVESQESPAIPSLQGMRILS